LIGRRLWRSIRATAAGLGDTLLGKLLGGLTLGAQPVAET
jgi:hypothetical protein